MNKWISILLIILILGGIAYYGYRTYEPLEKKDLVNISISTKYNDDLVKTGIQINGESYNSSLAYETFQLEKGINTIKNININNQNFYEEELILNLTKNQRIDIKLSKPEYPKVTYSGTPIKVKITSNNFKDVDFCLKSSIAYLFVEPKNYTKIEREDLANYGDCYDGNFTLNGQTKEIEISYLEFISESKSDYIELTLIDKDNNLKTYKIR